jgi:hypothetical protein
VALSGDRRTPALGDPNLGTLTTGVPERRGLSSGSDLDDWLLLRCNTMFGNGSSAAYVARCACLDRPAAEVRREAHQLASSRDFAHDSDDSASEQREA